jgi:hypothetical protein
MKVTAIIPDSLVHEVQQESGGRNITESITIALKEWRALKKIRKLNLQVRKKPLSLRTQRSYRKIREVNRKV